MQSNFNTKQAADYLKSQGTPFTVGTLEVWRSRGKGPAFKRVSGRSIFYTKEALDDFTEGIIVKTVDSI